MEMSDSKKKKEKTRAVAGLEDSVKDIDKIFKKIIKLAHFIKF